LNKEWSCGVWLSWDSRNYTGVPQGIIRVHMEISTMIHSNSWHSYDGLVDVRLDKQFHAHHGEGDFAKGGNI